MEEVEVDPIRAGVVVLLGLPALLLPSWERDLMLLRR
jgi:hypothetical protein